MIDGVVAGDQLGLSVASAGDVNNDGYADVVLGAHRNDAGMVSTDDRGRAYVYLGASSFTGPVAGTLTGAAAGDYFGYAVSAAGDVNGDGYGDVAVGAFNNDGLGANAGRTYIYFGASGAAFDPANDGMVSGSLPGDLFGTSVAGAGDLNGDGYADVVVGAPLDDAGFMVGDNRGRVYIYFGVSGGAFPTSPAGQLTGVAAGDNLGQSVF